METFQGRPYAAEGGFAAAQRLENGGTVQDWRTRELRELEARTQAAEAQQAAQPVHHVVAADSGGADDAEPGNVTKDPDGITE